MTEPVTEPLSRSVDLAAGLATDLGYNHNFGEEPVKGPWNEVAKGIAALNANVSASEV